MDPGLHHLPHVDEHSVGVAADPGVAWEALLRTVDVGLSSETASRFAALLGCADSRAAGPRPLQAGSAITGFHVAGAVPAEQLALAGSHRFSDYALIFRLEALGPGETRVRAETRAEFPGVKGRAYRSMVIGTRFHVLATRRILAAVKRRAERG
jgi:hypothetical protein